MFTNFLTSTTSRYTSLRRTLLSSSSEDDSSVDDPESSHVSRVLRAYYTEKGRPFPAWLGTDPRAVAQAQQPQQSFAGSAQSSLRGQSSGSTGNVGTTGGGGLGDLWADSPSGGKQPEEPGSLRRGFRPRPGMRGDMQSQSQRGEELNVRQLPSQRAGSYQTQGQGAAQSQQQLPGRNTRPTPSNTASSGSVQERLKARLGNRSSGAPSPPLTGYDRMGTPLSNPSEGGYDDGGSTGGRGYGGGQGSSRGNDGYDWGGNWGGGGRGNDGGGGRIRNESGLAIAFRITACAAAEFWLVDNKRPRKLLSVPFDYALTENARLSNESLLWGPYRPNLYFGVRPRLPKSLTTGLLWAKVDNFESVQNSFRHTCEQNEGMAGYGWEEYDARQGGRQVIHDSGNHIDITTEFVKIPGGKHGGNWGVRVKGKPSKDAPSRLFTTMIFYAAMEGFGSLSVKNDEDELGIEGSVIMEGSTSELGSFTLDVTEGADSNIHPYSNHPSFAEKPLDRAIVASLQAPDENIWQAKQLLFQLLKGTIEESMEKYGNENAPPPWQIFTIPNNIQDGNLHFVQKVFEGAFEFDILYSSASADVPITSEDITTNIKTSVKAFSDRFSKFLAPQAPFDKSKYQSFAKSMFSNLIGGIGYFYGNSVTDRSYASEYEEENEGFWEETAEARGRTGVHKLEAPTELYTSIPSRTFFPRGFLWDEGFHLLPIADWDMDLTLEIVKSWFNLMDDDGWIGREQILGAEARSKVPMEFQVQYPHYANPPTLFLIFEALIDKIKDKSWSKATNDPLENVRAAHLQNPDIATSYLRELYPLLKRHYFWFRKTQRGDIKSYDREAFSQKEGYRWRGRTPQHILTSGLDDYPRAQPPHPGELHTDLISWVGMMTRSMRRIAEFIDEKDDADEYKKYETAIIRNIDDLHWDKKAQTYCDATIDDYEESAHVCHKGYISIFPFLTGLVPPDSPRLGAILDLIADPEELWSDYGLRSLSKKDEFYGTDENYWRSPIWMNINYMAVKSLLDIARSSSSSPHAPRASKLYTALRKNLVETVFAEWTRTGFAWEQYNPETGHGQRTQHFTGWTSLVVKIMAMPDLDKAGQSHGEL